MWLISSRDLRFRFRRFLIAIAVTALVFGIAVAIDGIKQTLADEPAKLVTSFDGDTWVVREGSGGVFASTAVLPASVVDELRAAPGVRSAEPVVTGRTTVSTGKRQTVNLIGFDLQRGGPALTEGRAPTAPREAVVGDGLDVEVGDRLETTSGSFRVVGRVKDGNFNGGAPTVFLSVRGAQQVAVDGQPLVMGIAVRGRPETLPPGTSVVTNGAAIEDMRIAIGSAASTIDFVALLTWLIAAGVIGAIVYLTAIERTRDFAVLRATGSPKRLIVGGLMIQSLVVAVIAALLAVPLAFLLRLGMPLPVTLTSGSMVRIVIVGIVVGVLASLAAVRRAITTDPALAFGGA